MDIQLNKKNPLGENPNVDRNLTISLACSNVQPPVVRTLSEHHKEKELNLEFMKESLVDKYEILQVKLNKISKVKEKLQRCRIILDRKIENLKLIITKNKIKKINAIHKFAQVKKARNKMYKELHVILKSTEELKDRECRIKSLIVKMLSHRNFIQSTIALLPKDYVKTSKDQSIEGLMTRFKSLFYINGVLFTSIGIKNNELKILKDKETDLKYSRDLINITASGQAKKLYNAKDAMKGRVEDKERSYYSKYVETRRKFKRFGKLLTSLDNITNKCISVYKPFSIEETSQAKSYMLKTMPLGLKLTKITEFIEYHLEIVLLLSEWEPIHEDFLPILRRQGADANKMKF